MDDDIIIHPPCRHPVSDTRDAPGNLVVKEKAGRKDLSRWLIPYSDVGMQKVAAVTSNSPSSGCGSACGISTIRKATVPQLSCPAFLDLVGFEHAGPADT